MTDTMMYNTDETRWIPTCKLKWRDENDKVTTLMQEWVGVVYNDQGIAKSQIFEWREVPHD